MLNLNPIGQWDEIEGATGTKLDTWGWRVIRDYSFDPERDEPESNRQGRTYGDYQGGKNRYRIRDTFGKAMFIIESDVDPIDGYDTQLFAPLDWARADVGATSIEYKDPDTGEYKYI